MKKITGVVSDRNGIPMDGASVLLKNKNFDDVATAITDKNGYYCINANEENYPYMMAVRDYKEVFLEHWVGNISVCKDTEINFTVDTLEVYSLTCFTIRGGGPALSIYFRPMSLEKYKSGAADICPDINMESIAVDVNGEKVEIGTLSEVAEFYPFENREPKKLRGYLLMTALPKAGLKDKGNFLNVKIQDVNTGAVGYGGLFFDK